MQEMPMTENDSPNTGDDAPIVRQGSNAHEALLRRSAAARLLAHGDRARAVGIDVDEVAASLMLAADDFAPDDGWSPKLAESDLDLYYLGEGLGRKGCPLELIEMVTEHFETFCPIPTYTEPMLMKGWRIGREHRRRQARK